MSLQKVAYIDGRTLITAKNLNDIQDNIINNENTIQNVQTAVNNNQKAIQGNQDAIENIQNITQENKNAIASNEENIRKLNQRFDNLNIYPVGAIYLSVSDVSPASLFGGTWERIRDTFLLACGDNWSAGSSGGEATHTLTESEMPSHGGHVNPYGGGSGWYLPSTSMAQYGSSGRGWRLQHGNEGIPASSYTGGSNSHNNMPPYLAVYMWRRIA